MTARAKTVANKGVLMHCETEHETPVDAVATIHDSDSESAANITFLCGPCVVRVVQEVFVDGLETDRYNLEIRPFADETDDEFGADDDDDTWDDHVRSIPPTMDDDDFGDEEL